MTSKTETAIAGPPSLRLVNFLMDSFPVRKNLDYFVLCQAGPLCTALPDHSREAFESVSAFIAAAISEGFIRADHFVDGTRTFFWNVAFTPEGYRRATSLLKAKRLGQDTDERDLLLDLCFPDKPKPNSPLNRESDDIFIRPGT